LDKEKTQKKEQAVKMQKAMKDLQDNLIKEKKLVKELQSQLATTQDTMKSADVESERD
jgi:hypothetical protein